MTPFHSAVFLDRDSIGQDVDLACLAPLASRWYHYAATHPDDTLARIEDADLVIVNKVVLDADTLAACRRLKLICVAATGTNNVDLVAAAKFGVTVCNVRAYGTASVVQQVFALLLALTTRLDEHRAAARDGRWAAAHAFCLLDMPFRELAGKTLGIVGHGELGQGVALVAQAFGMRVLIAQRSGGPALADRVPLDRLLGEADVVSLHVPLADNTRNLFDARRLALMKPDAVLINTARGGIVDEAALVDALRHGRLGGAGFDVLSQEPPPADNPLLTARLHNLIVTPHVAWAARESRQRLMDQVADNIRAFLAGRPRNRVTTD